MLRHDRTLLRAPIRKAGVTIYEGVAARVHPPGDGLRYPPGRRNHEGAILPETEYRDLEELRGIIKGLPGTRIIVRHPDPKKAAGRLTDEPVVGEVISARLDDGKAVIRFQVRDRGAQLLIDNGTLPELSLGYGVPRLDAKAFQRGSIIDHLALVEAARCGDVCSIRTDCADMQSPCTACAHAARVPQTESQGLTTMATKQNPNPSADALRSLESQRADAEARASAAQTALADATLRADTAEGKILELEKQLEELRVQIAAGATAAETEALTAATVRADAAEAQIRTFDATLETRVRERVALERQAAVVLGDEFRLDGLSDREITATVVKHLDASADVGASVPDGILKGRFMALTERNAATARSIARVAEISASTQRADAKSERAVKRANSWKEPLPNAKHTKR